MKVVASPEHLRHDPPYEVQYGHQVPVNENPRRAEIIEAALRVDHIIVAPIEHGLGPLTAVHDADLVAYLAHAWADWQAATGDAVAVAETFPNPALRDGMGPGRVPSGTIGRFSHYAFDTSTPMVEGTYAAARAAVDVALSAVDAVVEGGPAAYGLCRPPGHHAPRAAFGGFCFFNNAAIAAQHALTRGAARVAVLDVDYHHGNGTQQIFYERGDVLFVSLHADPDRAYPYFTGFTDETGAGRGLGANRNVSVPEGCTNDAYLALLDDALGTVDRFAPEVLVVSLGVDTHGLDPLGDLALTTEVYEPCGAAIAALGRPTVVLQEGGYHLPSLGANVAGFLRGLAR